MSRTDFVTFEQDLNGGGTVFVTSLATFNNDWTDVFHPGAWWSIQITGVPPNTVIKRSHNNYDDPTARVQMGNADSRGCFVYTHNVTPQDDPYSYDTWFAVLPGKMSGYPTDAPNDVGLALVMFQVSVT